MPTASTAPMILLIIVLWWMTKGELLSIILFTSIFEAASMINIAGSGVAPWTFVLACGLVIRFLAGFRRPQFIPGCNMLAVRLLLVFICYAIWTGMTHPFLFRGVPVFSSHGGGLQTPLSWGTANLFQIIYLMAVAAIYMYAVTSTREKLESAVTWYVRGCLVICFFGFYQLANAILHVPYPSAVLYSNPGHTIYPAYRVNGMWRLNSTLPEASSMALHLSVGVALQGWQVLTKPFRWFPSLSLAALFISLLLTQSSSGYLALGFSFASACVLYAGYLLRNGIIPRAIFIGFILAALVASLGTVTSSAPELVRKEINSVILEKKNSASYRERTASNVAAMESAQATYYLGAGYGSLRCSGLGYMLIGNVGVPGFLLFFTFIGSLFLPFTVKRRGRRAEDFYERCLFATAVSMFMAMVAGAEPISPILWVLFAAASAGPYTRRTHYKLVSQPAGVQAPVLGY